MPSVCSRARLCALLAPALAALALASAGGRLDAQSGTSPSYPPTRITEQTDVYHGTAITDPYRWLEDVDSPETKAWVEAQNAITFAYLGAIPERDAIRGRLTKVWDYPKYGVPFTENDKTFYFENSGLQNQSVLYVKESSKKPARVLLDPNRLSSDGTVALSTLDVSPNARYLAYGVSVSGSDWQEFRVRDVQTGRDLADTLRWVKFSSMSWTQDNKGFFYSRYDAPAPGENARTGTNRNQKLFYHRLGRPQSRDVLIYERPDQPDWMFSAEVSEDGMYAIVYITESTANKNRLYVIDLNYAKSPRVTAPMVKLFDDFDASYDFIGNVGTTFYLLTNRNAEKGRVIAVSLDAPKEERWRTIIPEGDDALQGVSLFGQRLVARYLHDAHSRVKVHSLSGVAHGDLALPAMGSVSGFSGKPDENVFFYAFTSYLYPTTVFKYDLVKRRGAVVKAPKVDFDVSPYETKQLFATSKDGTRVPIFVTAKKGLSLDGNNPTLLYGYGGFNVSLTPGFSPATLVWLEMGGVYAVANLRGGGEYGKQWHESGTLARKQNVFDDFIASAEYLIREKYTSPTKLAIQGGSNGGLLVGAAMTQRPELFGAALPAVGVMDMLRFHKFTIGWAWVSDYGSADDSTQFPALRAYSPLHNLKKGVAYPATLVTTADHDDRVVPGHSFKFAAALQAAHGGPSPVLIRIETKAGHGAGKPTTKQIEEVADRFAFLVRNLSMMLPALSAR